MSLTRRGFLASAAGVGVVSGISGCGSEGDTRDGGVSLPTLTRPLLRPWADDIVWLSAPTDELPVAYVSMALRQVFVDHEYRDRATSLLLAHISVSTALWRIPLPGDPVGQAVTPGDELREFEELNMRQWNPSSVPEMDDIRILRGAGAGRRVDFSCVPLVGSEEDTWLGGGPWDVVVADGGVSDTTREDFMIVGSGSRHSERTCAGRGEVVQYVSWASRAGRAS